MPRTVGYVRNTNMSLKDYKGKIDWYLSQVNDDNVYAILAKIWDEQERYMKHVRAKIMNDYSNNLFVGWASIILTRLLQGSGSGNVIIDVLNEEHAEIIAETANEVLADYLLEPCITYKEERNWVVDCMFGGYYTPGYEDWWD